MNSYEQKDPGKLVELIGFTIGNNAFGLDIGLAHQIIRSATITSVPNAPDFVEGVINLRGDIFPVIDLRKKLNLYNDETSKEEIWIMILEIQGMMTGFIVDTVTRVLKVYSNTIKEEPKNIPAELDKEYITGMCDVGGVLLMLLDFNKILLGDEVKELNAMEELP
jgi:purine-binding chemotaxis protein CheW